MGKSGRARRVRGGDDAGSGAGHDGIHRRVRGNRAGDGAAVSLHHKQFLSEAAPLEFLGKLLEVAVEDRLHAGVHRRGDAALVLAVLGKDGVAGGDVAVRPAFARELERALFVRGVDVAVQEMDDERFATRRGEAFYRVAQRGFIERYDFLALGVHALGHFDSQLARHQRLEPALQPVRMGPCAPAQFEHVAKAPGRDEARLRELALQERVGRGGGAVHEHRELRQRELRFFERGEHAERLVIGRGGNLGEPHFARGRLERDQVGERAADVNTRDPAQRRTPT